jgi:hypothetical protein
MLGTYYTQLYANCQDEFPKTGPKCHSPNTFRQTRSIRIVPQGRPTIAHRFNGGYPSPQRHPVPEGRKKVAVRSKGALSSLAGLIWCSGPWCPAMESLGYSLSPSGLNQPCENRKEAVSWSPNDYVPQVLQGQTFPLSVIPLVKQVNAVS